MLAMIVMLYAIAVSDSCSLLTFLAYKFTLQVSSWSCHPSDDGHLTTKASVPINQQLQAFLWRSNLTFDFRRVVLFCPHLVELFQDVSNINRLMIWEPRNFGWRNMENVALLVPPFTEVNAALWMLAMPGLENHHLVPSDYDHLLKSDRMRWMCYLVECLPTLWNHLETSWNHMKPSFYDASIFLLLIFRFWARTQVFVQA